VPALGILAISAHVANAEDKAPTVTFSGWSDNILSISDTDAKDSALTQKDDSRASIRFIAAASLKANVKVTDALSAKINLWFYPDTVNAPAGSATTNGVNNNFQVREAYFNLGLGDGFSWLAGKYIDHIGWISAEPTGLFTVNNSLIGYLGIYGNDVIGTSLAYAPANSPFSGSIHITNGYFTSTDAVSPGYVAPNSDNRENTDLGYGLDLTYAFPEDKGNINAELAYDVHSGLNAVGGGMGGDALLVGLNATIKPIKPLLIGAEIQNFTVGEGTNTAGTKQGNKSDRTQGLLLANWALSGTKFPMSITAEVQYIQIKQDPSATFGKKEKRMGEQIALLTNPLGTTNFGLNFELGLFQEKDLLSGQANPALPKDLKGWEVSVEGLVAF
jgi:hypothetical protein